MRSISPFSVILVGLSVGLTGCFKSTRLVQKTQAPDMYRSASVETLEKGISDRDDSVKTFNASVTITASVGGGKEGKVDTYTAFNGYIFVRKPRDLRVIMQLPVVGSRALDMVSNGDNFTLVHATASHGDVWIEGTNSVSKPSKNGLENLRPQVFFDSLLVPAVPVSQYVSLTESTRILQSAEKKRVAIEEPDYDMAIAKIKSGNVMQTTRVVHISRVNMLPFQQDIYDDSGKVVTSATYDKYQEFDGVQFPTQIVMNRPLDEYSLRVQITKLTVNGNLMDDQFDLKVPQGVTVQKMQ